MWKRAFLSIRRRKVKSLILFLIMLIVFSGLAGGAVAEKTMTDIQKQLQKNACGWDDDARVLHVLENIKI